MRRLDDLGDVGGVVLGFGGSPIGPLENSQTGSDARAAEMALDEVLSRVHPVSHVDAAAQDRPRVTRRASFTAFGRKDDGLQALFRERLADRPG